MMLEQFYSDNCLSSGHFWMHTFLGPIPRARGHGIGELFASHEFPISSDFCTCLLKRRAFFDSTVELAVWKTAKYNVAAKRQKTPSLSTKNVVQSPSSSHSHVPHQNSVIWSSRTSYPNMLPKHSTNFSCAKLKTSCQQTIWH